MADYDGYEPTGALQNLVNEDHDWIQQYGRDHPEHFGGMWVADHHFYAALLQ
jgi:hypothetical protein